ncbi:MAG: serpin family protein [Odoribacter sp.]|nr:serpin family protein [Odoribacter sp.]
MKNIFIPAMVCMGLLATGCTDAPQATEEPTPPVQDAPATTVTDEDLTSITHAIATLSPELQKVNDDINKFSISLLDIVAASQSENSNIAFSPLTETINMMLFGNAADDALKTEIETLFNGADFDKLTYVASLLRRSMISEKNGAFLTIASSVWAQNGLYISPEYSHLMDSLFLSPVTPVNFSDPATVTTINDWCKETTNGLIPNMVTYEMLQYTELAWLTSLYFEGEWSSKFNKELTREADFHSPGGTTKVEMMHKDDFAMPYYKELDGFTYAMIPFSGSSAFHMILPPEGMNLNEAASIISNGLWERIHNNHGSMEVILHLDIPKFEIATQMNFNSVYAQSGIYFADAIMSAFGKTEGSNLDLIQKASIRLDEDGATAAAVSYAHWCIAPNIPFEKKDYYLTLDRPFFFFINNNSADNIIFAGRVVTP